MTLQFRPLFAAAMFVLGAASAPALAQDSGWFIGAGGGISKYKSGCAALVTPGTCDDNGNYWRVFGGYQFNSYFGYEMGYGDLGELTRTTTGVGSDNVEAKVLEAVLVLTIPLVDSFSVYAKYGIYSFDADRTVTGAATVNAKGREMTYGFGAKYDLTKNIALRAEWQHFFDVGDSGTGTFDVNAGLIGIVFKF